MDGPPLKDDLNHAIEYLRSVIDADKGETPLYTQQLESIQQMQREQQSIDVTPDLLFGMDNQQRANTIQEALKTMLKQKQELMQKAEKCYFLSKMKANVMESEL